MQYECSQNVVLPEGLCSSEDTPFGRRVASLGSHKKVRGERTGWDGIDNLRSPSVTNIGFSRWFERLKMVIGVQNYLSFSTVGFPEVPFLFC